MEGFDMMRFEQVDEIAALYAGLIDAVSAMSICLPLVPMSILSGKRTGLNDD